MSARKATVLVMAKMALSDEQVTDEERAFLQTMMSDDETIDGLIETVKSKSVADLVAGIDNYADRFFIALRAASMAHIDAHLDAREEVLLDKLLTELDITKNDQSLIQQCVDDLDAVEPVPPDPRIEALYMQSSFS